MKHAILIIGHSKTKNIQSIIDILDDEHFAFFIHWDAKSDVKPNIKSRIAPIKYILPIELYWGTDDLLKAEVALLKIATEKILIIIISYLKVICC